MGAGSGETRWSKIGGIGGEEYAARFEALAAAGHDPHGEASFTDQPREHLKSMQLHLTGWYEPVGEALSE